MLKAQNNKVHVFLEIPAVNQNLEVLLLEDSTFHQCLKLLHQLLPQIHPYYEIDEETLIMEKKNMQICDKNIPLSHLHVQDGMTFLLF